MTAAIGAAFTVSLPTFGQLLHYSSFVPQVRSRMFWGVLVHLAMAAILWTFVVAAYRRLSKSFETSAPTFKLKAGSVMTETLIILPVFLLLMFGLAQLAVNNVAGILSRVASYEAARTAWIWWPEAQAKRAGMQNAGSGAQEAPDRVKDKVRIAVALVMTPVAPGDYASGGTGLGPVTVGNIQMSEDAKMVQKGMAFRFWSIQQKVEQVLSGIPVGGSGGGYSIPNALDSSSFGVRALRKFEHAYAATPADQISVTEENGEIVTEVHYWHFQAMPYVGAVFGRIATNNPMTTMSPFSNADPIDPIGGRPGYYQEHAMEYSLPKQRYAPNPKIP